MAYGDHEATIDCMIRKLALAAALLATAGCGLVKWQQPQANPDRWANIDQSGEVTAARESAAFDAERLIAALPVKPARTVSTDGCAPEEEDNGAQYQFSCTRSQTWYVPVGGDFLPLLAEIDAAVRERQGQPSEYIENVKYYNAHGGKSRDGLQLPKPRLAYWGGFGTLAVDWTDPAFAGLPPVPPADLAAGHGNVLIIRLTATYYTVPWSEAS
jgi:hypothetical protein